MKLTSARRGITLVGLALAASALPIVAATSSATAADAPTTTYRGSLSYLCDVSVPQEGDRDIILDDLTVRADVSFAVPALKPNVILDPVTVKVDLTLPEDLRGSAVDLFDAVDVSGESTNVTLSLGLPDGTQRTYQIPRLAAPRTTIPTTAERPWVIPAAGVTPKLPIQNAETVTASGPQHFDVAATLFADDGGTQAARLSCDVDGKRALVTIPVGTPLAMTAKVEPGVVKAGSTTTTVLVKTTSDIRVTGLVQLFTEGGKFVGSAELNKTGNVRVKLDPYFKTGRRTLKVVYFGDAEHVTKTITTKFSVVP